MRNIKVWIIVIIAMAVGWSSIILLVGNTVYMKNFPANVEQAEIVDKRIIPAKGEYLPKYLVTFKFSDGTEKEFFAGRPKKSEHYNAVNIGETGILTYKEKGNDRRFESFEKDIDLGGAKIEPYRQDDENERVMGTIVCIVFVPVMVFLFGIINDMHTVDKSPEQRSQVQVADKRIGKAGDKSYNSYYVTFKFDDDSEKEFMIGMGCVIPKNIYDAMDKGDIGTLTYKESEKIISKIKNKDRLWFGRNFVKFEKQFEEKEQHAN